jgi:type VI secretion system protein ImpA
VASGSAIKLRNCDIAGDLCCVVLTFHKKLSSLRAPGHNAATHGRFPNNHLEGDQAELMSAQSYFDELVKPLSADAPCGESIEDTQLLASFDGYRLFGQVTPLAVDTDWREIKTKSLEALEVSKDYRLLGHLAAAALRVDSLPAFCSIVKAAAQWLETHWDAVHPRLDDDAIMRKNALNCLADRMAIVDALRRQPLVTNPQLGSYSLRDYEIATGQFTPPESEAKTVSESEINAAFTAASAEELIAMRDELQAAIAAVKAIDAKMRNEGGSEAAPALDDLASQLAKMHRLVADQASARTGEGDAASSEAQSSSGGAVSVGAIKSRQDAIRALDAVAMFFRQNEPSSPVPLFIERAKRLVAKDFLEVLADIAPDAMDQAKAASGIRDNG